MAEEFERMDGKPVYPDEKPVALAPTVS